MEGKTEILLNTLALVWLVGVPVYWSYLMAYTYVTDTDPEKGIFVASVVFGWIPSILWPIILMVQVWLTWWF